MILKKFEKQPSEVKDYGIDFTPWLSRTEDTLYEVLAPVIECITNPDDSSLECFDYRHTETEAKFWLRGGISGYRYKMTIQAQTTKGRLDESELIFRIKDY